MNKREVKEALADKEWWEELEIVPGWTLYGWTFKNSASFHTDDRGAIIQVRAHERDAILAAVVLNTDMWTDPQRCSCGRICVGCAEKPPEYDTPVGPLCNADMQEGIAAGEFSEGDLRDHRHDEEEV